MHKLLHLEIWRTQDFCWFEEPACPGYLLEKSLKYKAQ